MRSSLVPFALLALAVLTACQKEKPSESAAATGSATTAVAPAATVPQAASPAAAAPVLGAAPAAENIPVAADFEDEAEKSITKANYRAELDSLEAEIK